MLLSIPTVPEVMTFGLEDFTYCALNVALAGYVYAWRRNLGMGASVLPE
jgi:hypothetical protein